MEAGRIFIMLDRGDYWQCAFVIPKGSAGRVCASKDIGVFRKMILELSPWLGERVDEIKSWDDVKLLTVALDRLSHWYRPGLLCIGDAAHAMSPVGGVGINLAVQDAVAAANILAAPLRTSTLTTDHLARVQAPAANGRRKVDTENPAHRPEPRDQTRARRHEAAETAVRGQAVRLVPGAPGHPGPAGRHGGAPGAYSHPGR